MEIAKVNVSGARCTPESVGTITRGMVGATVSIEYTDPLWDDLTKTALSYRRELGLTPAGLKKLKENAMDGPKRSALAEALAKLDG